MGNVVLAYGNQVDSAALSMGSWAAAYPLANLKDYRPGKVARTTNVALASTKLRCALAAPAYIGAVVLHKTNATPVDKARVRIFTDNTYAVEQYTSGWFDVYPAGTLPADAIPVGAPNYGTGRPTQEQVDRWQNNIVHVLGAFQYGQYLEIEVDTQTNTDGFFEAGRLFVGQAFQPKHNISYDPKLELTPRTHRERAVDGTPYFDTFRPDFSIGFSLDWLTQTEGFRLLDMQVQVDLHGEVLFVWNPNDPAFAFMRTLFGRLAKLDPLTHPMVAVYRNAFQVEGTL